MGIAPPFEKMPVLSGFFALQGGAKTVFALAKTTKKLQILEYLYLSFIKYLLASDVIHF